MSTFRGRCLNCDTVHTFTETTPLCDNGRHCSCADGATFTAHCPSGDTQLVLDEHWRIDTWRNEAGSATRITHMPTGSVMTEESTL